MITIKERYCSFKISKLLQEKDFDEPCRSVYDDYDDYVDFYYSKEEQTDLQLGVFEVLRPTHQMAMDWLREEYKIAIDIRTTCEKTVSYAFDIWDFEIIHPNKFVEGTIDLREQQCGFKSYEDAVEAALEYCLTELI